MKINPNLPERFWSRVDKSGPCWRWTGGHINGYGVYYHEGKNRMVQRVISEPLPTNKKLQKKCGNLWCINPEHFDYNPYNVEFEPPRLKQITVEDIHKILQGGPTDHLGVPPSFIKLIRKYVCVQKIN